MGLPLRTPTPIILAEAGQPPLHAYWLGAAVRLWIHSGAHWCRLLKVACSCRCWMLRVAAANLPWAVQLQRALEASGVQFDPHQRTPLSPTTTEGAVLECHLRRVAAAANEAGATRLRLYFRVVRPDCLSPKGMGCLHTQ